MAGLRAQKISAINPMREAMVCRILLLREKAAMLLQVAIATVDQQICP